MDLKSLVGNTFPIYELKSGTLYQIKTYMQISQTSMLTIYIEKTENGIRIFDNKQILSFMQHIFDFKSQDVQNCLKSVLQVNGIKIAKGDVFVITDEANFSKRFMDYLICASQLIRMYAFFDKT